MKSFVFFTALIAAAFAASKKAPLHADNSPTAIKDEYIVVFQDNIAEEHVRRHHSLLNNLMTLHANPKNEILHHHHIGSFRSYSARLDAGIVDKVRDMEEVKYVERNQQVKALQDCIRQESATWGIARTTHRDLPILEDYSFSRYDTGEGVDVYIIDTGIDTTHPDFGGRARWGVDYIDNPSPETDGNGHGTHCAGTVMSDTYGLAKGATAIAVRVLNNGGSGSYEGVISGVVWVANQHDRSKKSVANMSLGGGKSISLNDAVNAAVEAGVHFSIAAGNEAQSACNVSPASAEKGVCVAASDNTDKFAYFSNYGECVNIIAPGVDVTSTWNDGGIRTISGTSMAAPHVAGVMAKILTNYDLTPDEMKEELTFTASKGKISVPYADTPNELLYNECPTFVTEHASKH